MKRKIIVGLIAMVLLVLSIFSYFVFAQETNVCDECRNIDVIWDRIKSKISDVSAPNKYFDPKSGTSGAWVPESRFLGTATPTVGAREFDAATRARFVSEIDFIIEKHRIVLAGLEAKGLRDNVNNAPLVADALLEPFVLLVNPKYNSLTLSISELRSDHAAQIKSLPMFNGQNSLENVLSFVNQKITFFSGGVILLSIYQSSFDETIDKIKASKLAAENTKQQLQSCCG